METRYKVITEGKLRDGVDPEQFVKAFAQAFKVTEEQARKLLTAGEPVTLKQDVDRNTAEKFRQVLTQQMGLEVRIEAKELTPGSGLSLESASEPKPAAASGLSLEGESESPAEPATSAAAATPAAAGSSGRCPKCGSDQISGDDCLACGVIISRYLARKAQMGEEAPSIYAAPASNVLPDQDDDLNEEFALRSVDAAAGWRWIVGGWKLFTLNPGIWIGMLFIWIGIFLVASIIPLIGPIASNILAPVFTAGFMLGAHEQRSGGSLTIGHLFAGFSMEFGKLVQVGLLSLAAGFVIGLVLIMFGFGTIMMHANGSEPSVGSAFLLILLVTVLLALMAMAFLFAPQLVVFERLGPIEAIKMSFAACWKNAIPFLVYGLIVFGLALIAMIPLFLGFIVLSPVLFASMYVAYRSIFYGED